MIVLRLALDGQTFSLRLLREFGRGEVSEEKIAEIWTASSQHEVLFSDLTFGDPSIFLTLFADPRSVWLEILEGEEKQIGLAYLTDIIPHFDMKGHFTFWDGKARGKEPILQLLAAWLFARYNVQRISAEIPIYQKGVCRFIKRVGFKEEGKKRDAILHKGTWLPLSLYGLTRTEFMEENHGKFSIREDGIWHPDGDTGRD